MLASFRKRVYGLQQLLAITTTEAAACIGFVVLIGLGGVAQVIAPGLYEVDTSGYAEFGTAIAAAASRQISTDPTAGATEEPSDASGKPPSRSAAPRGPVQLDPNTAPANLLQRLPGIGPALAARIVEHRELHGPFRRPRDITRVSGIGERTFERLAPYLVIGTLDDAAPQDRQPGQLVSDRSGAIADSSLAPSPP